MKEAIVKTVVVREVLALRRLTEYLPRTILKFGHYQYLWLLNNMAPLARGRGRGGGGSGFRGGPSRSHRGRGKARGVGEYAGNRGSFKSTRIEEQREVASEEEEEDYPLESDGNAQADSSASSSSDEEDVQASTLQPYNALLLSLNGTEKRSEPQRKRRKISNDEDFRGIEVLDEETEPIQEPEDREDSGPELLESDMEDADQSGEYYDPFMKHFGNPDDDKELEQKIQAVKENNWSTMELLKMQHWLYKLKIPQVSGSNPEPRSNTVSTLKELTLKRRLRESSGKLMPPMDKLSGSLAFNLFNYHDIFFPHRSLDNSEVLRKLACLHAINHVFKTRDLVIKDNARLAREDAQEDAEYRDQGFTRPKILMILPTRNSCVNYVDTIISLCEPEQQENKKRFQENYATGEDPSQDKPQDFRDLFGGNDDDMFRLGLKFTRKTVKFFAQFYNSDIIFASPLGLRIALGTDDPKKQDYDFLSSIEIVIFDQTDAMLMQNWEHVERIFEHLNLQPKEAHGCDFSRVRTWYLDGNAKYLRQTILLSAFNFPSLNRLFTHQLLNVEGKVKYSQAEEGAMIDLNIPVKQTFSRFDFGTPIDEPNNRFKYFTSAIVPSLTRLSTFSTGEGQGILIYLSTYADFVRVRNYLATSSETQAISFGSISEYTSVKDVARARSHFLSGRHAVLLYTERAHHFRRYRLKGVKKVVMYALPENPKFYKEIVGDYLGATIAAGKLDARSASVRALFSPLDILKLERIVGTGRHLSMLKHKGGDTFDFI